MLKQKTMRSAITITLIVTMLTAMMPSWYLGKAFAADGSKAESEPYKREATDYGIQNDLVSAVRIKLNSNTSVIDKIDYVGVMLLREDVSSSVYKYYLVGRGGEVIHSWQTASKSTEPQIELYYQPDAWHEGTVVERGERAYPYSLVKVKDPNTGKYDVYNADTGEYCENQADSLRGFGYSEGAYLVAYYNNELTLISPTGQRAYDEAYFKDIQFLTLYNNVVYLKAKYESGKYVIISSDGQYEISTEYQDIEKFDVDNYLNEYEGNPLDAYVVGSFDIYTKHLINVSTGEALADGLQFESLNYAGDRVFFGVTTDSKRIVMTDYYWFDAAEKMGFKECNFHSGQGANGNIFATFNNRDKYGNGTDYTDIAFDRYGDAIITGTDLVGLIGDYYIDYTQGPGLMIKSIETGEILRGDIRIPSYGIFQVGNFAIVGNAADDVEDRTYFWLNTETGDVLVDGIKDDFCAVCCNKKGSMYILLKDDKSGKYGIIDTANNTFSGFNIVLNNYEKMYGFHNDDGTGVILILSENEDDESDLQVYNTDFERVLKVDNADASVVSADSNGNYTVEYIDEEDERNYYHITSYGTVINNYYLNYTTSLMDHHRTILNRKNKLMGLSASDGSVILPTEYKFVGREFNGVTYVSDDPDFLDYWERLYSYGAVDYYGDWLIYGEYYTKGDDNQPGRNLLMSGPSNYYYFYDLNDYVDDLYSDDGTMYYNHKPVKEITEADLYGDYYQYLNNEFYRKVIQNLWGDMNLVYGDRTGWDNAFAVFISNMKEGGAESVLNAMICDVTGEYYKQGELEEKIAMEYLKELSEDQNMMSDIVKGFNKVFKWSKKAYEVIETGIRNPKDENNLAVMMEAYTLLGNPDFTRADGLEIIRSTKSNWDKIDKAFKTAGKSVNAAEVAAMICVEVSFSKYMISTLMDSIDKNSELYKGLQRVRMKNNKPVGMLVAELVLDDVFSLVASKMKSEGIGRLASVLANTGGVQVGMATTVAGIGYYFIGSLADLKFASSDEVVSACISICNQTTLQTALSNMKADMQSYNSGKGYEEKYPLIYRAYMISIKKGVKSVLRIAKAGKRKQLQEDFEKYEKYLSYERYLDSCLKNANASLNYTLNEGKATITGYNKRARRSSTKGVKKAAGADPVFIDIPRTIDGYEVEAVSKSAFKNDSSIAGVYVPKNVTNIGEKAFEGCSNLTDVFFEEGLEKIGDGAFTNCSSLETIELPASVNELGDSIFEGTDGVTIKAKDTALIDQYISENDDNVTSEKLPAEITGITITTPADKQTYTMSEIAELELLQQEGDDVGLADLTGMEIKATYDDGTEETVTEGFVGLFEEKKLGENTIKVCYGNASTSFTVNVTADECSYEIAFVDERGMKIADSLTSTAMAGSEVSVEGADIEGYRLVSEPRNETIGADNYFEVEYETIRKPSVGDADITLSKTSYKYNGKARKPAVTVEYKGTTLTENEDYTLEYENNIKPGYAAVVISGTGEYEGLNIEVYKITKADNTMTVKGKTVKVRYSRLKKKNQTIKRKTAITVKSNRGKVTYKMAKYDRKAKKKIVISKAGKITVKKGLKKGKYKIKVKVTAAGNTYYLSKSKTAEVKITVK